MCPESICFRLTLGNQMHVAAAVENFRNFFKLLEKKSKFLGKNVEIFEVFGGNTQSCGGRVVYRRHGEIFRGSKTKIINPSY